MDKYIKDLLTKMVDKRTRCAIHKVADMLNVGGIDRLTCFVMACSTETLMLLQESIREELGGGKDE